ncbi:MAG: DMT family transporter [Anaerorhabdus sp.]|uniref:DMT family transporter n=1 Tax=Anaerorhabdus sp. TaxID=1872524 RepID=UPI003A8A7689
MYSFLALLSGFLLALMITMNGMLAQAYNIYLAAIILHVVAVIFSFILCRFRNEKFDFKQKPMWIYLGGVVGVFITMANNLSFGQISMTSIIALGLFGQILFSIVIDVFGLFKMPKRKIHKSMSITFLFALLGILLMLDNTVLNARLAILYSFGAGILVVLNRTINARLAEKIGALPSSFVNHLVGLPITIIIAFFVFYNTPSLMSVQLSLEPFIYLGGIFGVTVVYLSNITVYKLSAFKLTIFTFVAQLFTGIVLDMLMGLNISDASFNGGILISLGILINIFLEKRANDKVAKQIEIRKQVLKMEEEHFNRVNTKYTQKENEQ